MKFKKHISIFLAVLLLVSNVGLAFNVHYCGSKIASVSLSLPTVSSLQKDEDCCLKKAIKKESCCKDKKVVFKEKASDKIVKSFSFQFDYTFLVLDFQPAALFTVAPSFKNNLSLAYYCDANAPPLFKLYSQYLLYDTI